MAFVKKLLAYKHLKLALFVAPVLVLIGYIGSDYYLANQNTPKLFQLSVESGCDLRQQSCIAQNGDFNLNLHFTDGNIHVEANHPFERISFLLAGEKNAEFSGTPMLGSSQVVVKLPLAEVLENTKQNIKLRMIVQLANHLYLSEWDFPADARN